MPRSSTRTIAALAKSSLFGSLKIALSDGVEGRWVEVAIVAVAIQWLPELHCQ